uniref:Protein polybromo-1 n=3 Tax=Caenorhabditis japonica TaxID=281687 RepID=A0A8R1HJA9_CAEJA
MSTKRRRVQEPEPEKDVPTTSAVKKRKGRMTILEKERREHECTKGRYVMSKIYKQRNTAGTARAVEFFLRLPSRRLEPEYYEKVSDPIDIQTIQLKLRTPDYLTYNQFFEDLSTFLKNNKIYYKEDSDEHKDILKIEEVFKAANEKVESEEYLNDREEDDDGSEDGEEKEETEPSSETVSTDSRDSSPMELDDYMICDLLGAVLEATDSSGRLLCPPFRVLQSRGSFPAYYEKISQPIDLKTIAQNGKDGKYTEMKQLKDELMLLFKNAQEFSGKGSDIYKDAELLKQVVREKIAKLEEKGVHPMRRAKALRLVDALLTAVQNNENYSEDSEEDEETEKTSDPMWKLYWKIRNATHEKDRNVTLADNFLELPSKESYPDYYDEIKQPVSLFMINKRLKNKKYEMKTLVADLMQMYSNAFEYNLESSEVYVAAKKLKILTLATCKQLDPALDLSTYEPAPVHISPVKSKPTPHRNRIIKIEMETDSEDSRTPPPTLKRKSPKKPRMENGAISKLHRKSLESNAHLKHKHMMQGLWNCIYQYRQEGNPTYWPAGAFMELPSLKELPEYYQIIQYPIDMKIIRQRIDHNQYPHVDAMINDCRLMFANARDFNEPSSNIHIDAIHLEKTVLRAYEGMRNTPHPVMNTTPSAANLTNHNRLKIRTPKTETRGRKKKVTGSDDEEYENHKVQHIQNQQKSMEDVIQQLPPEEQKMWRLFKAMKDVREEGTNRVLAINFMRLPTKEDLPSYYEVIKKPMDMLRIKQKLENRQYVTLLDVVSDFMLMLSNACKFNETDSDIYKEAVALQKALLEMKRELDTGEDAPRVQVELRTIFTSIFASLFSKKDEEGKCFSDQLTEITEILKSKGVPADEWPFTLDQIKMNIDKCRYRRLDRLQKDFFDLFEKVRELSKVGSPMYVAACTLQKEFIVERDGRCKDVIFSNAYSVIEKDIDEAIEYETSKRAKEDDDGDSRPATVKRNESEVEIEAIEVDGVKYAAPCYAYVSRTDDKKTPLHIFRIERTFKNETGEQALQGLWVYRPEETLHLASRKFIKQEVFVTPFRDVLLAERLRGHCVVVSHATFIAKILTDYQEEDVYLCEYKYHGKPKYFSKMKAWPYVSEDDELECTKRGKLLSPKRALTAADAEGNGGKEVVEDGDGEGEDEEDEDDRARTEFVLDIDRTEFPSSSANADAEPGRTYFQQIRSATGKFFWLGQFVLVFNEKKPLCDVMRINKLWREEDGSELFSGCWFARPGETIHDKGRLFFKNEVIAVFRNDEVRKVSEIQRICDVMPAKHYVKQRQTEISECDVFVCETMVNGAADTPEDCSIVGMIAGIGEEFSSAQPMNLDFAKQMRKLKTYKLNASIPNEETLFYKTAIKMDKELSPLLKGDGAMPLDHLDEFMEDDTDGSESVSSTTLPTGGGIAGMKIKEEVLTAPPPPSTPTATKPLVSAQFGSATLSMPLLTPKAVKSRSGYILFSAEVRKRIMHENPEAGFGEVSKIVGIEWKKLSEEQKKHYELRAEVVAAEKAKQDAIKATQAMTLLPGQIRIWQCKWATCDTQYDSENALLEHVIHHHTSQIIMDSDQQYVCMWMTCLRNRKDGKPFPSLPRLHRHIKEKHMPTSAKNIYETQLGRNFFRVVPNQGNQTGTRVIAAPYGKIPEQNGVRPQPNGMNGHPPQTNGQPMHHQQGHHEQSYPHPQQQQHQQHQQQQQHFQQGTPHSHAQMAQAPNGMYQQTPSSSQQYHPQQGPPPQMAAGPHHSQHQAGPPQHQQMQQIVVSDVGRTVVRAIVPAFVAPPNQIHSRRVLHSEAYLKYIESLAQNRQKSVSRWERSLGATHRNTQAPNGQPALPAHWIRKTETGRPVAREEDVSKALWKLRDELLKSTCSLSMDKPN